MQLRLLLIVFALIPLFVLSACERTQVKKTETPKVDSAEKIEVPMNLSEKSEPIFKTPNEDGWYLVWEEDFSGDKLNQNYWIAINDDHSYNDELQYYSADNVMVETSNLTLTATDQEYDKAHPYTSGKVTTEGKVSFHYGKLEINAKYPTEIGMFPAIWMLPAEFTRQSSEVPLPEIDIFENVGNDPNTCYAVLHYLDNHNTQQRSYSAYTTNPDEFHLYAIEWTKNSLSWFVDGKLVHSTAEAIPTTPMYLIINLAVGGSWFPPPNQTTKFPAKFEIDYVKYYQK